MPSSKDKKRSKTKKSSSNKKANRIDASVTGIESLVNDVEGALGWYPIVYSICIALDIPDLSSRSGLKKIHQNFPEISGKLDTIFSFFHERDYVAQAIIAIYTRMCADSILRNRLIEETDFLPMLFDLLERPACCHVSLQALCAISHHSGLDARLYIAKKTSDLLRVLEKHKDDTEAAELTLTVISHSLLTVLAGEEPPDPSIIRALELARLTRLTLAEVRKPTASRLLISHALFLFANASHHSRKELRAYPSAINLLVAFTRAPDITSRAEGLLGIMRLHIAEFDRGEPMLDPKYLLKLTEPLLPHLNDALMDFGFMRTESFYNAQAAPIFQQAIVKAVKDRDFCALGRTIAHNIMRAEYSVLNGSFAFEDGQDATDGLGLPFKSWIDALPLCARDLRARGVPAEQELADIIDLKYMIIRRRLGAPGSVDKIKRAIEGNPRNGFFYFVLSLCADTKQGLRAAKKGLRCPELSDYVRNALLYRSLTIATTMGLEVIDQAHRSDCSQDEGIAFLMTAWEDAKAFISGAPPDSRNMSSAVDWYVILTLALHGPETSIDFRECRDALNKMKIADEISQHMNRSVHETQSRMTRTTLIERMPSATKEWDSVVAHYAKISNHSAKKISPKKAVEDLAAWLDELEDRDGEINPKLGHQHESFAIHPKINPNAVELYRCSWCKNPSAVLRKCSKCETSRYCDSFCQKEHWKEHRKKCKPIENSAATKEKAGHH